MWSTPADGITLDQYTIVGLGLSKYANTVTLIKGSAEAVIENVVLNMPAASTLQVGANGFTGAMSELQVALGANAVKQEVYETTNVLMNFTFDEASGEEAIDTSSLENNGTIKNGAVRKYGTYDVQSKGIQLDASAYQCIQVPGSAYSGRELGTSTLSAWVYTANDGTASDKKRIIQQPGSFDFYVDGTGVIFFTNTVTGETYQSSESTNDSAWTHIAVSLNEFNNTVKFFKNGSIANTATPTTSTRLPLSGTDIEIGKGLTGVLDNVMIHVGYMNVSETPELYRIPDHKYSPDPVGSDEWSHIAAVYDRDMNMVTMYQNGRYVGCHDKYLKEGESIGTNANNLFIATTGDSSTFYDGTLDDLRVYKRALTKDEIGELYSLYEKPTFYFDRTSLGGSYAYDTAPEVKFGTITLSNNSDSADSAFAVRYYAFAMETERLTSKGDIDFFLDNIDSVPTTAYVTRDLGRYLVCWIGEQGLVVAHHYGGERGEQPVGVYVRGCAGSDQQQGGLRETEAGSFFRSGVYVA